jgi:biotin synthase
MDAFTSTILEKGLKGDSIALSEAERLVEFEGQGLMDLLHVAGQVARRYAGRRVDLCTIINAKSGWCSEDCRFCAQSAHHNTNVDVYPLLSTEQLVEAARKMDAEGVDRFGIVTSGKGISDEDLQALTRAIKEIRRTTKLEVCASLGILSLKQLKDLKAAGLARYHHNIETASSFYSRICSTHSYSVREQAVRNAQKTGLEVCCGVIIGMGETWQHRIEMAFALRDLDPDSIPINILNPIKGTALEKRPLTPPLDVLKTIALFRFVNPTKSLRYAGGREVNMGDLQSLGLIYGLDGMMTGNYLTTTGREPRQDKKMVKDLGFAIAEELEADTNPIPAQYLQSSLDLVPSPDHVVCQLQQRLFGRCGRQII